MGRSHRANPGTHRLAGKAGHSFAAFRSGFEPLITTVESVLTRRTGGTELRDDGSFEGRMLEPTIIQMVVEAEVLRGTHAGEL